MFTQTGMETVVYYLKINYGVTLSDVSENPKAFQDALVEFLGDFGGKLLLRRMVLRLREAGGQPFLGTEKIVGLEEAVRGLSGANLSNRRPLYLTR